MPPRAQGRASGSGRRNSRGRSSSRGRVRSRAREEEEEEDRLRVYWDRGEIQMVYPLGSSGDGTPNAAQQRTLYKGLGETYPISFGPYRGTVA